MSTLTLAQSLSGGYMDKLPNLFPQFTSQDARVVEKAASVDELPHPVSLDDSAAAFDEAIKRVLNPAMTLMERASKLLTEKTTVRQNDSHTD